MKTSNVLVTVSIFFFCKILTSDVFGNTINLPISAPEKVGLSSKKLANIELVFTEYFDKNQVPGLLTVVARYGKIAYLNAIGYRDIENKLTLQRDTIFRIYSMSKAITSTAAMILYEEGAFELTDPISEYLPEFKDQEVFVEFVEDSLITRKPAKSVTIQQLFIHTAGFSYGGGTTYVDSVYRDLDLWNSKDLTDLCRKIASVPLRFEPGSDFHYSTSIDVMGRLIEVISRQTLGEFLADRIFIPLGMVDTGFFVPKSKLDRFSKMYQWVENDSLTGESFLKPIANQNYEDPDRLQSGGGGLVSTVDDYLKFCQMIMNQGELDGVRILSSRTINFMLLNHLPHGIIMFEEAGEPGGMGHGLGFGIVTDPARLGRVGSIGEASWAGYANTFFWIDPKEKLISMVWAQMIPFGLRDFRHQIIPLVHSAIMD